MWLFLFPFNVYAIYRRICIYVQQNIKRLTNKRSTVFKRIFSETTNKDQKISGVGAELLRTNYMALLKRK